MSGESRSVWAAIDAWASELKRWQRAILSDAIKSRTLSADAINRIYVLFLEDHLLQSANGNIVVKVDVSGRPSEPLSGALHLQRIDGLDGVNALPNNAALTFASSLTVIYGRNGAGKSGFARLLANVCFSRHKPRIIGNIHSGSGIVSPTATFHVAFDGGAAVPIPLSDETKHLDLRRFSFFDADVAKRHVSESSPFEYRPAGFDIFPEMARVYQQLATKLEAEILAKDLNQVFDQSFIGAETKVSLAVKALSAGTDIREIRELAIYTEIEQARLNELDNLLVSLRANSPVAAIEKAKQASSDIEGLINQLELLKTSLSPDAATKRAELSKTAVEAKAAASLLGTDKFKRQFFNNVGSPEWTAFTKAIHGFADKQSSAYPEIGDHCLLCERPLDEKSRQHVAQLIEFSKGAAQKLSETADSEVIAAIDLLEDVNIDFFNETIRTHDHVRRLSPSLCAEIVAHIKTAEKCRDDALSALRDYQSSAHFLPTTDLTVKLRNLMTTLASDIAHLESSDPTAAIEKLSSERNVLRHREVLSQLLPRIEDWVANAAWSSKAKRAKLALNPRHITDKDKELFSMVVGDTYRLSFKEECEALDCDLPIEMLTSGQKGKTVRSLVMTGGAAPDKILSEGEQRAIALADFLAEVNSNPANAGVIFDDPVTSQDHQRKSLIAKRLVAEASKRQVIVFTHDLPFLNQIIKEADAVEYESHWIDRDVNGAPGAVTLHDVPATSKDYDSPKRAKAFLADAKAAVGSGRVAATMSGMGALRRTVEETIAKRLFKGVIPRWEDRIIVTNIGKIAWDDGLADDLCEMFVQLSAFIEGHSHTDEAMGAPPRPEDLEARITLVEKLIRRAKADRVRHGGS